jgi:hypothetical protein
MTDARQAWSDAGHQLSALTAKLRENYEQQRAADGRRTGSAAGPTATPDDGPAIGESVPGGASGTDSTAAAGGPHLGEAQPGAGASPGAATGAGAKADFQDAVLRLSDAARDLFDALSAAAKDPSVKSDVKQVGNSVSTAFAATFNDIAEQVRTASSKVSEKAPTGGSSASGDRSVKAADDVPSGGTPPAEAPPADAPPTPPYGTPSGTASSRSDEPPSSPSRGPGTAS